MNRIERIAMTLLVLMFVVVMNLPSCKKPPAPSPTTRPGDPVACVVPGLGSPQTSDVDAVLDAADPRLNVVDFGTGRDGYLSDVVGYLTNNPHGDVLLFGHSYGGDKCVQTAAKIPLVKLMVLYDPIAEVGHDQELVIPSSVKRCVIIWADFSGLVRPHIVGSYEGYIIHKDHNGMMHAQATLDLTESLVKEALSIKAEAP